MIFDQAWEVVKSNINPSAGFPRPRCWLCEMMKEKYGNYPTRPFVPPNWGRPCDCS